jgi:hypothetical protein
VLAGAGGLRGGGLRWGGLWARAVACLARREPHYAPSLKQYSSRAPFPPPLAPYVGHGNSLLAAAAEEVGCRSVLLHSAALWLRELFWDVLPRPAAPPRGAALREAAVAAEEEGGGGAGGGAGEAEGAEGRPLTLQFVWLSRAHHEAALRARGGMSRWQRQRAPPNEAEAIAALQRAVLRCARPPLGASLRWGLRADCLALCRASGPHSRHPFACAAPRHPLPQKVEQRVVRDAQGAWLPRGQRVLRLPGGRETRLGGERMGSSRPSRQQAARVAWLKLLFSVSSATPGPRRVPPAHLPVRAPPRPLS